MFLQLKNGSKYRPLSTSLEGQKQLIPGSRCYFPKLVILQATVLQTYGAHKNFTKKEALISTNFKFNSLSTLVLQQQSLFSGSFSVKQKLQT